MSEKLVSVIIPCFNQGIYLADALESLKNCDNSLFETIIINDGSTDEYTNNYLADLSKQGYQVIFQDNKGLGGARNTGILHAKGKYILPLDADNKIRNNYIAEAVNILEQNSEIAVVYGNAALFGDKTGTLQPGRFNLQQLMIGNYIDACAVFRKSAANEVGLYDNMRIMGYEDWDLWLRMAFSGYRFYYINKVLFDYRVVANSMMRTLNADIRRQNEIMDYFTEKYADKLNFELVYDHVVYKMKKRPFSFLYYLLLKKYFPSYYFTLIKENKIYKNRLW